jgi:hypothetical protein
MKIFSLAAEDIGETILGAFCSDYELRDMLVTPDSQTVIVIGRDDHTYIDGDHYIYTGNIKSGEYTLLAKWRVGSLKLGFPLDKKYLQFDKYFWDWKTGGNILNQSFQALNSRLLPASIDVAEREQEELNKGASTKLSSVMIGHYLQPRKAS